jgi:hypothetical protein
MASLSAQLPTSVTDLKMSQIIPALLGIYVVSSVLKFMKGLKVPVLLLISACEEADSILAGYELLAWDASSFSPFQFTRRTPTNDLVESRYYLPLGLEEYWYAPPFIRHP